jgi:hypothetical protein
MALCAFFVLWPPQAYDWSAKPTWPKALILVPAFCVALMAMFAQAFNPLLYFQF